MEILLAFIFAAVFLSGVFVMMWGIHNQSGIAVISGSLLTLIGGGLAYFFLGCAARSIEATALAAYVLPRPCI